MAIITGGLGFDSRVGQIRHNVSYRSPPLQRFFGDVLPKRSTAEMNCDSCYTLRRNTASIMKVFGRRCFKALACVCCICSSPTQMDCFI